MKRMKRISLKDARHCLNMDKGLVCAAMGIDEDTLTQWEDGNKFPTVEQAIEISKLYGMPIDVIGFSKNDNRKVYDTTALRKRILKQFGSIDTFAEVVEMKSSTLQSRLAMKTEFNAEETSRIVKALGLSGDEAMKCFFEEYYSPLIPVCRFMTMLSAEEYATLKVLIDHGWPGSLTTENSIVEASIRKEGKNDK